VKTYAKLDWNRPIDNGLIGKTEMRETSRAVDKKLLVNNNLTDYISRREQRNPLVIHLSKVLIGVAVVHLLVLWPCLM
jgi:hypothetical protein